MENIRKISYCPNCGNVAPQKLIHTQHSTTLGWSRDGESYEFDVTFFVASCETCNWVLVYRSMGDSDPKYFTSADLDYPDSGQLHSSVPEPIRDLYSEAFRVRHSSANAFAVLVRKALEAICVDRGAGKGNLFENLRVLASRGDIPQKLSEVTDVLRLLGNIGAHAGEEQVRPWHVWTIDRFFRVIAEYIYVAPARLKEFNDSLSSLKKDATGAS